MARFFISYRRQDSEAQAGRLYDLLSLQWGRDAVFMDVDTVPPGTDYRAVTERHLQECQALLAIIGRNWQEVRDNAGRRRLDSPTDLVRFEIESALSRGITVIPVLVDGATAPSESSLPDSLKPLSRRQAIRIDTPEFRRDSEKLLKVLRRLGRPDRHPRWANWRAAAVLIPAVSLGVALASAEVDRAPVDIQLRVSQFGFRLADAQPILSGISVDRLGVTGLSEITLPNGVAGHAALLLESESPGRISLPPLTLQSGSRVWYQGGAVPHELHIDIRAPSVEFHASVEGRIRIGPSDARPFVLTFDVPEQVTYKAGSEIAGLSAMLPSRPVVLLRQVNVDSLSFTGIDRATVQHDPLVRAVSAVEGGTVAFWPGEGPRHELKSGDWLEPGSPEGQIRTVEFDKDRFTLHFAGVVQDLRIGPAGATVSVMPSYLEVAWFNHRLPFLAVAATCVVVAGLIVRRRLTAPS